MAGMSVSVPTSPPDVIYAGDRTAWRERIDATALGLGSDWNVSYAIADDSQGTRYIITGSLVSGETDLYEFAITSSQSIQYSPGEYRYLRIIQDGDERTVDPRKKTVEIRPDPEGDNVPSFDQQMVNALKASLLGRATSEDQAFLENASVNGDSIGLLTMPEMQQMLREYERRVAAANAKGRANAGKKSRRNIVFRF